VNGSGFGSHPVALPPPLVSVPGRGAFLSLPAGAHGGFRERSEAQWEGNY